MTKATEMLFSVWGLDIQSEGAGVAGSVKSPLLSCRQLASCDGLTGWTDGEGLPSLGTLFSGQSI